MLSPVWTQTLLSHDPPPSLRRYDLGGKVSLATTTCSVMPWFALGPRNGPGIALLMSYLRVETRPDNAFPITPDRSHEMCLYLSIASCSAWDVFSLEAQERLTLSLLPMFLLLLLPASRCVCAHVWASTYAEIYTPRCAIFNAHWYPSFSFPRTCTWRGGAEIVLTLTNGQSSTILYWSTEWLQRKQSKEMRMKMRQRL